MSRTMPRDVCPWPGCDNDKVASHSFCNARDCQSKRLNARLLGRLGQRPLTDEERSLLDLRERKVTEYTDRYRHTERGREVAAAASERYRERLRVLRAAHRRRMQKINEQNQLYRKQSWERAMSQATSELLELVQAQQKDDRITSRGQPWVLSLDAPRNEGTDRTLYDAIGQGRSSRVGLMWQDPTYDAVEFLLDVEEWVSAKRTPEKWTHREAVPWDEQANPRTGFGQWDEVA